MFTDVVKSGNAPELSPRGPTSLPHPLHHFIQLLLLLLLALAAIDRRRPNARACVRVCACLQLKVLEVVAQALALGGVLVALALGRAVEEEGLLGRDRTGLARPLVAPAALLRRRRRVRLRRARAAVRRGRLRLAVRGLLAHERALGLLALRGPVALPVAQGLLAHGLALGLRVGALGVAHGLLADGVALGARPLLAVLDRAAHLALRLLALDGALGAAELLAAGRALGLLADRLAHLVADGGVALPLALRVAVALGAR